VTHVAELLRPENTDPAQVRRETCAMTLLPVHTVRRLYEDRTLEVIEDLIGGGPFDQASDPLASQYLDPDAWRSMHKGPLMLSGNINAETAWAFARALAYDRYLPTVVLSRARSMRQASQGPGPVKVVYFPDAIGILHHGAGRFSDEDTLPTAEARMCLVARDIDRPRDFLRRNDPFEKTVWRWLDHLHAASVCCKGLSLPRVEHLARAATADPLELAPIAD
jgi:hypothetical protein